MRVAIENPPSLTQSYPMFVTDEMWYFSLYQCQSNCSTHGECYFGYCICDIGYYGIDCSNTSCAGTFCQYDTNFNQVCVHACHAGYNHTDNDVYIADLPKLPCTGSMPVARYS